MPRIKTANVKTKRAYEPAKKNDGTRVLVDRLWPRGVKKTDAAIDEWLKEIAPSSPLRKWFGHDPERGREFRSRYKSEVKKKPQQLEHLRALARRGPVTLVYAAHDEEHNNAIVLRDMILEKA